MPETILVVDDDPVQRRLLDSMVRRLGYEARLAESGDQALAVLSGPDGERIDAVVLDLVMPDLDGMGVLGRLREMGRAVPVIVQTAHGGIDTVVSAMRAGACDFVVKPVGAERLHVSLRNALKQQALETEIQRLKRSQTGTLGFKDIVTRSERMMGALRVAEKAAPSTIPVLVDGESGTGKELVARAIHGSGERRGKPFVAVNCGALPENLIESILFGHEKGAFTGATEKHLGKFVEANGGTLFLDEVGELPPAAQVKLLRAIQDGVIDPVGGRKAVRVDVRIISATNRNLLAEVKAGHFREDLFYRLHVYPVTLPPLRERREDVPDLVRHFLARFCAEQGRRISAVTGEALALLKGYPWPGNVRQLENTVFRAVVLAEGDQLTVHEFPQIAAQMESLQPASEPVRAAPEPEADLAVAQPGLLLAGEAFAASPSLAPDTPMSGPVGLPLSAPLSMHGTLSAIDPSGHVRPYDEIEADLIRLAVSHYNGQMSEVARRLKIGRSTLYRKLKDLGLDTGEPAETA
jgi:DNA-binding NtrC family response regulator